MSKKTLIHLEEEDNMVWMNTEGRVIDLAFILIASAVKKQCIKKAIFLAHDYLLNKNTETI